MRSRWVLILVFFLFSLVANAVESVDELQAALSRHRVIRGTFQQTKTLEMFNNPLLSKGHFLLSDECGLLWNQAEPFAVMLVLGSDSLSQKFDNSPAEIIKAKDNPMMFYFSRLFLSVFRGEMKDIEKQFAVEFIPGDEWLIRLVPIDDYLSVAFKIIEIKGRDYIENIRLEETSGDITEIKFTDQNSSSNSLTEKERSMFEF